MLQILHKNLLSNIFHCFFCPEKPRFDVVDFAISVLRVYLTENMFLIKLDNKYHIVERGARSMFFEVSFSL